MKQSHYVVWTRANCVCWNIEGRIYGNEAHRKSAQPLALGFVGIDTYRNHLPIGCCFLLTVNGKSYKIKLLPTGGGERYNCFSLSVFLHKGTDNEVRLETEGNYLRPDRVVVPAPAGNMDELQICEKE